jgi:hypothetical protein
MAFPPEPLFLAITGSQPATIADELGMLLQTKFHHPKHSKIK